MDKKSFVKLIGIPFNILGLVAPQKAFIKSMELFAKPRKGRLVNYQEKYLSKFEQSSITIFDHKIQVYKTGSGPYKIILAHGWESNSWRWRKFIKYFGKEDYTFIMLDAPAHGLSEPDRFRLDIYREAIYSLANRYNADAIIGHSVGGLAVLLAASKDEFDQDIKLVSMGAPFSLESIFEKYFSAIGFSKRIAKDVHEYFNKSYKKFGLQLSDFDIKEMGEKIPNKGLIIHDKEDNINEYENATIIAEYWNRGELVSAINSTHSMQTDDVFMEIKSYLQNNK